MSFPLNIYSNDNAAFICKFFQYLAQYDVHEDLEWHVYLSIPTNTEENRPARHGH